MPYRKTILFSGLNPDKCEALLEGLRRRDIAPYAQMAQDGKTLRQLVASEKFSAIVAEADCDFSARNTLEILSSLEGPHTIFVLAPDANDEECDRLFKLGATEIIRSEGLYTLCEVIAGALEDEPSLENEWRAKMAVIAKSIFRSETEAVMLTDKQHKIRMVNSAFCKLTGFSSKECLGLRPRFPESGKQDVDFFENFWREINNQGNWQGEVWYQRKSGETFPAWLSMSSTRGMDGQPHYVAIFRDITQSKQVEAEIIRQASMDSLTNLPNRTLFFDRLNNTLKRAKRTNEKFAVLFLDLDHFKEVNDERGHAAGDIVLKEAATRLLTSVRKSDTVARLGGDEFAVIVPEITDQAAASLVAEKIASSLGSPFPVNGEDAKLGASIGIAVYPKDGGDRETLLNHADIAMYQAKRDGRGGFRFYEAGMTTLSGQTAPLAVSNFAVANGNAQGYSTRQMATAALVLASVGLLTLAAFGISNSDTMALKDLINFSTAAGK